MNKFKTIIKDSVQEIRCDGEDHVSVDKQNKALHSPAGSCICKPQHTPTPWKLDASDNILGMRDGAYRGVLHYHDTEKAIETSNENRANAAFIVRAANNFQALVDDCRSSMEWFEANGYPQEAANIKRLLAKAEGK